MLDLELDCKFTFSRTKVNVVIVNDPIEGNVEEREKFWNDLDRIMDRVGNGCRL